MFPLQRAPYLIQEWHCPGCTNCAVTQREGAQLAGKWAPYTPSSVLGKDPAWHGPGSRGRVSQRGRSACLHICFVNIVPDWAGRGRIFKHHNQHLLLLSLGTCLADANSPSQACWAARQARFSRSVGSPSGRQFYLRTSCFSGCLRISLPLQLSGAVGGAGGGRVLAQKPGPHAH